MVFLFGPSIHTRDTFSTLLDDNMLPVWIFTFKAIH